MISKASYLLTTRLKVLGQARNFINERLKWEYFSAGKYHLGKDFIQGIGLVYLKISWKMYFQRDF